MNSANYANYATYQKEKKKMMENFAKGLSAFPLEVSISYLKLQKDCLDDKQYEACCNMIAFLSKRSVDDIKHLVNTAE